MSMEVGEKISFTRKTYKYGNSVGIVIPAQLRVVPNTVLRVTVERIDPNEKSQ